MKGQALVASFTTDVVTGCSPLYVSFKDQSSGSPKSWNWVFDNGTTATLSNQQNPVIPFGPGTYSVTLTVKNSSDISSVTKTNYIVSNPSPAAGFSADKLIACLPTGIQFKDISIPNAGNIVKWEWDFGDGTQSGVQNPLHNYTATGFYDVYLRVTSSTGCLGATSIARYIRILNGVKADFNVTGPATCTPPFNVLFNNLTSGPGNLTYNWDLANTTSTQTSPSGTYPASGNYVIKLNAVSDLGCSANITKTIPITGSTTSFQVAGNKDTVCLGTSVTFQSTASPVPSKVVWDFGDGSPKFTGLVPPAKTYASPGIYTVTMSADFASCSNTATRKITVSGLPVVDFYSTNNNSFCKGPAPVLFQNLSPDMVSATWNFGDGGTSNSISPSVTHTYGAAASGNFPVSLSITDSKGCVNKITKTNYVNILAPAVTIGGIPAGLCKGQSFTPTFTGGTVDGVASYDWDFGDGGPHSTLSVPAHSYAANGNYIVKLTIVTNGGCTASGTGSNPIQVGDAPIVDFSKIGVSDCRSKGVIFTNLSTPLAGSTFLWDFNDGSTSTLQNPLPHKFPDTGNFTIKLKVTSNGCTDSATKPNFVHILPPLANFGFNVNDCTNKTTISFSDSSATDPAYGLISWQWNFGDPANSTSTAQNPSFPYPGTPSNTTYNVQLVTTNGPCADTITKTIPLINEKAAFTMSKAAGVFCRNEDISFSSTNDGSHIKSFEWIIDGMPPVQGHGVYPTNYSTTGSHTVSLIITDLYGCKDTSATKQFSITGPTALFGVKNNGGCKNSAITFSDSSVTSGPAVITKWTFDFGDGTGSKSFTSAPFTHQFADTGVYTVKLIVVDNNSIGCQDTFQLPVIITKPRALFSAAQKVFCPGVPLQFTDSSFGYALTYAWDFGDGGTSNIQNPQHQYNGKDSMYTVKLAVIDSVGCADTLISSNYISVRSPKPFYTVKDTATLCPPLETKFTFTGKDYESFSWAFGDGGTSSLAAPNHFYNSYGNYTAKLYTVGYGGCIDSASINITVTDPIAATSVTFNPNPAQGCNNLSVNFSVTPPYSTKFKFYFGDGGIDSSQQTSITHLYNLPNTYDPFVFLEDSVGCKILKGGLGSVHILGGVPLFGIDNKKFCDSGSVYFTDYSQSGNDPIVKKTWDFGDGSAPVVLPADATHTYTKSGLYLPTLSVTTAANCTLTITDTVRVLATPQPVITSADGVCANLFLNFAGSLLVPDTNIIWKWSLGNGQTASTQSISIKYADTGIHHIILEAANSLGCKQDTTKDIIVYPLPVITIAGDTSIVSGGTGLPIPFTYSSNVVSYSWTPPDNLSCSDCPNPVASRKYNSTYKVTVTDANGCISSRNVTVLVTCSNKNFFIPNTFSPNNDGANDWFYPRGTGLNLIQSLRIFNRWGEMVFEKRNFPANDASSGWDGTYKGKPAGTDTYIYMINIICDNATIITYKGNITLIR